MYQRVITRETCRVCSSGFFQILDVGDLFISTFVEKKGDNVGKAPLILVQCENKKCELVQLKHTAPQELLYKGVYWYKSGVNEKIVNDLREIAQEGSLFFPAGTWIDIGANDGTLFNFVHNFKRIAVEPAKNLAKECKKNSDIFINKLWEEVNLKVSANIITAIGMFYDSENPNAFIKNVKKHLHPKGVFITQFMTLKAMDKKNDIGNICHEHLEFYSYKSMKHLFERNGLEIFRVEENNINGGSYRLFARHFKEGSIEYPEPEFNAEDFRKRIETEKERLVTYLKKQKAKGREIYGYGASTKGNTILQYYGLGHDVITAIADRNPDKYGLMTVGTHIPIVPEKEAREKADIFFVLPYAFIHEFCEREKEFLNKGGELVVCIPEFRIYSYDPNYK